MNLLQNEIELYVSATKNNVTLTNFRLVREELRYGSDYHLSVFLEDISSIELHYKSNLKILFLGILILLYAFYNMLFKNYAPVELKLSLLFFGTLFVIIWWFTRIFAISVKPNGGERIDCEFNAASNNNIREFLTAIEQAKLDRINSLHHNTMSNISTPKQETAQNSYLKNNQLNCPSCSHAIKPSDVFCENCGNKLK